MKHDRCTRVAARQHRHRLRDVFVATLGAGILAFQITAFGVSLGGQSSVARAADSQSAEIVVSSERCERSGADDREAGESQVLVGVAPDGPSDHCS